MLRNKNRMLPMLASTSSSLPTTNLTAEQLLSLIPQLPCASYTPSSSGLAQTSSNLHNPQTPNPSTTLASSIPPILTKSMPTNPLPYLAHHPNTLQPSCRSLPFSLSQSQRRTFSSTTQAVATQPADPGFTMPVPTSDLTPQEVVDRLDKFIIGQAEAKKAVAIAFRNRWRRHKVPLSLQDEIVPKNILMIGPTGCGKTEIARRLAKLADSPFIKVEATKFTEVGYHGRDVETIIRDLVELAITQVRTRMRTAAAEAIKTAVNDRLLTLVCGQHASAEILDLYRQKLLNGELEQNEVNVEVQPGKPSFEFPGMQGQMPMVLNLDKLMKRKENKRMTVAEARPILEEQEGDGICPQEVVVQEALRAVQQDGIVFIDEIDKIVSNRDARRGMDPSAEGVQRDLLPIIEGSVISTKHGNVATDHILFICSGAFHSCKPSDLMAELQGRLPIRVELKPLTRQDFYRILTEPEFSLIKQQQVLLRTEGVDLTFTDEAIHEIARIAEEVNRSIENIGARRLHTVLEKIMEEVSFDASELARQSSGQGMHQVVIGKELVTERLTLLLKRQDLSKFIL